MRHFVVSPFAAEDLNDIWEYVAQEWGEAHADATLRQCVSAFGELAELPGKGHLRQDLTRLPLHFFSIDPYLIIYRRDSSPLSIHAVLHSSRNIRKLLRKRPIPGSQFTPQNPVKPPNPVENPQPKPHQQDKT